MCSSDLSVVDDAKLEKAIRLAQLEDFVAALPEGLETRLGPDGAKVSGGEKARIALVRALLAGPDILVLDEATASLDSETEERIYRRLLAVDYTVIGVTHRLSTLKLFPRIVVLADGRFVLDGSAQELADRTRSDPTRREPSSEGSWSGSSWAPPWNGASIGRGRG